MLEGERCPRVLFRVTSPPIFAFTQALPASQKHHLFRWATSGHTCVLGCSGRPAAPPGASLRLALRVPPLSRGHRVRTDVKSGKGLGSRRESSRINPAETLVETPGAPRGRNRVGLPAWRPGRRQAEVALGEGVAPRGPPRGVQGPAGHWAETSREDSGVGATLRKAAHPRRATPGPPPVGAASPRTGCRRGERAAPALHFRHDGPRALRALLGLGRSEPRFWGWEGSSEGPTRPAEGRRDEREGRGWGPAGPVHGRASRARAGRGHAVGGALGGRRIRSGRGLCCNPSTLPSTCSMKHRTLACSPALWASIPCPRAELCLDLVLASGQSFR